jgi:hypothetical protein
MEVILQNKTGATVVLNNETGGTATNRFTIPNGNLSLVNNASAMFIYSSNTSRWVLVGHSSTITATAVTRALYVKNILSSGTNAPTFTSGSYQTVPFNTLIDNTSIGGSLSSNQITLPAGTYKIDASICAFGVYNWKAKLRNVTDSTDVLIGTSTRAENTDGTVTLSVIIGEFTIASSKTFEIQARCLITRASGMGISAGFGDNETYSQVKFELS